jgi:hypothetical protein
MYLYRSCSAVENMERMAEEPATVAPLNRPPFRLRQSDFSRILLTRVSKSPSPDANVMTSTCGAYSMTSGKPDAFRAEAPRRVFKRTAW